MKGNWIKITDQKMKMTEDMHGKILRVGKKFVRIDFPEMPKYWENGNDGVIKTDQGWKEYKLVDDEMRIIGYK